MEKFTTLVFAVDKTQFHSALKKLMLVSFLSSFFVLIDGVGVFFIPFILGSFIVYQFYEEKQRIPFVVYFLPFIFLFIFLTGGGTFIIDDKLELNLLTMEGTLAWMMVGIWCACLAILCVWLLFKVKLKIIHFLLVAILVAIPYLIGLNAMDGQAYGLLFYMLWNAALSVVLSLLFSQKPLAKQNL